MKKLLHFPGVSFSLKGVSIPNDGSGHVLITDINPNGENNEDALICRSEIPLSSRIGEWYLHPTRMSTNDGDRIMNPVDGVLDRGWNRNRDNQQGHRLVRLKKVSETAEEGVFTCIITGDNSTPRYLYITYSCEL